VCYSESFESLSEGLQNALWALGKVPHRHRTDRLSTAVNNMSDPVEFTDRYKGLMRSYGPESEKTQAGHGNENGDVEQRHHRFKRAVAQELLLRGSVLLTSNLPFSKWEGIFKDPMTTAAAIDRLVHHSVILELNIPSYRMEQATKNRSPAPDSSEAN
jgi:hypothetical protein